MANWAPQHMGDWAQAFGLVAVPFFGANRTDVPSGYHAMMQDGKAASFALHITGHPRAIDKSTALGWAWSSNVRHAIIVDQNNYNAVVFRWDDPSFESKRRIASQSDARKLVRDFERVSSGPPDNTVIDRALRTFSLIRSAIEERGGSEREVVLAFTTAIQIAERWRTNTSSIPELELAEAVELFSHEGRATAHDLSKSRVRNYRIGAMARFLTDSSQVGMQSPYLLDADLLIRHASGVLFQEAHRMLAQPAGTSWQPSLFNDPMPALVARRRLTSPKTVHYTPPWLARALVESAVKWAGNCADVKVLDPACGSGVFLIETIRELDRRGVREVALRGLDSSAIAVDMTDYCVHEARLDADAIRATHNVQRVTDSLKGVSWDKPDIVLMNPPYKSWKDLNDGERTNVKNAMGDCFAGRPDLYLGFLATAAKTLGPGGVLVCVLPTSFFSNKTGLKLRRLLHGVDYKVRLLMSLRGFDTFANAHVEAAAIVVCRTTEDAPVRIVLAQEGNAEKAVRVLRALPSDAAFRRQGYEIFNQTTLSPANWQPARHDDRIYASYITRRTRTTVKDLFTVRLGVRGVGAKRPGRRSGKELIVPNALIDTYAPTKASRLLFRKIADKIVDGRVVDTAYVFYPYGEDGRLLIESEIALVQRLPAYYTNVLHPNKPALATRDSINRGDSSPSREWWEPSEPVKTWLAARTPRIISQEFGKRGNYAIDVAGEYAIVAGNGWCWKSGVPKDGDMYGYLAILNSKTYERLLALHSTQFRGGQYRLEARYINNVPLPEAAHLTSSLVGIGKRIAAGEPHDSMAQDFATLSAYGVLEDEYEAMFGNEVNIWLDEKISALDEKWRADTGMYSSPFRIVGHHAYQDMIALGLGMPRRTLAAILGLLAKKPAYYYVALNIIAGMTPFNKTMTKDIKAVREAWLQWGRTQQLI